MPKFRVNIGPGLSQIVEAQTADDARKIVKAEIAKGALASTYDKVYFDYDTGVPIKSLRRKLARAETPEEQESVLTKAVGTDGYLRNSKGQLALTPIGLTELGLPFLERTLDDGSTIKLNTIIDERDFDLKSGDLADFMGITGPVLGAAAAFVPQLRVLKGLTALAGNKQWLGRLLASGVGSASGKLAEEAADLAQGFQLQEASDLAGLAGYEFGLGVLGQGIGEGIGYGVNLVVGAKASSDNLRLMYQAAMKRSINDVKKLDIELGREATEAEIKKAIKEGKIFTGFAEPFLSSQATQGKGLAARVQQIFETVLPRVRDRQPSNIDYLTTEIKYIGGLLDTETKNLSSVVDDVVKSDIDEGITSLGQKLRASEYGASKELVDLVDDMTDKLFKVGNYKGEKGALSDRAFGIEFKQALAEAEKLAIRRSGAEYDAVDELFRNLRETEIPRKVINQTISRKILEAKDIITQYKKSNPTWKLFVPEEDIQAATINRLDEALDNILNATPNADLTQIRNAISDIKKLTLSLDGSFSNRKVIEVLRKLDDSDIGGSDSILTDLENNGASYIADEFARANKVLTEKDAQIIELGLKKLRDANNLHRDLFKPFDNAIIKKTAAEAEKKGAFNADVVINELVYKGTRENLEGLFKALDDYDNYMIKIGKPEEATTSQYAKAQIKKRLFFDAFQEATDTRVRPGEINFAEFAKKLERFEGNHPGKLDVLFSDIGGTSTANAFRAVVKDLRKLDPRLKANDIKNLINDFTIDGKGLSASEQGRNFIQGLQRLSKDALELENFERNVNLSRLAEKPVDEVVETIFRPRNGANIRQLENILDAETFQNVKDASFIRFLENSIDFGFNGKGAVTDIFKPGSMQSALTKYGDDTLDAMFGKETTQALKQFADTMDILTKGEPGRGGAGAGGIVAAGIGASILFAPLSALPTITGLLIVGSIMSTPRFIKLFTKTDKGSIRQLVDIFNTLLLQTTTRGIEGGITNVSDQVGLAVSDIIKDVDLQELQKDLRQSVTPTTPTKPIPLPEVQAPQVFEQDIEARRQFAEDLFRRPVI
jgi:hypothetical protein